MAAGVTAIQGGRWRRAWGAIDERLGLSGLAHPVPAHANGIAYIMSSAPLGDVVRGIGRSRGAPSKQTLRRTSRRAQPRLQDCPQSAGSSRQ